MSEREFLDRLVLPFDELKTLANGGAEVHLYLNTITGTKQVGKRIDLLGQAAFALREAKLLQTISHDHLVPVLDVAVLPEYEPPLKVIELVMPYYQRGSICEALLRGERFSVGESVRLVQQILRGLGELHDVHGILHRDMKSPNVFLTDDGSARVGDLGACVELDLNGEAEPYHSMQPTTPPETYLVSRVGRSYDVFGVGVVLFELLNGALPYPYDPNVNHARLKRGLRATPDNDLTFKPHVASRLRTIVRTAMARDPAERYQNVSSMRAALTAAPYIDWLPPVVESDLIRWEGTLANRPERRFQIEARRRKSSREDRRAWVMVARQRLTVWRRSDVPDRIVSDISGKDGAAFFDQVLSAALKA